MEKYPSSVDTADENRRQQGGICAAFGECHGWGTCVWTQNTDAARLPVGLHHDNTS